MNERPRAKQPGPEKIAKSPNQRRFFRWAAVGTIALSPVCVAESVQAQAPKTVTARVARAAPAPAQRFIRTANHQVYVMPATTMPETGVKVTCDMGCNHVADGNYTLDQEGADMQAAGLQMVDQYVILDQVVKIGAINGNSPDQCDADNNPNYNLVQLDQIVSKLNSIGVDVMLDLDSPRLASINLKALKCIVYAIANHYNGQTPGGPVVDQIEGGNEANVNIPPEVFAGIIEAIARGAKAGNKAVVVRVGGLRDDGTGMNPTTYLNRLAGVDTNPTFDGVDYHEYPDDWKHPVWQNIVAKMSDARQAVNSDWTNRAYQPGAQYTNKAQRPLLIGMTESGARVNFVDSNGVSPQAQANYDAQEIRAFENNDLGIDIVLIFHWLDEPAGPNGKGGWQLGAVHFIGRGLNQPPVVPNKPMWNMWSKVTAETRAGATSATS